MSALNPSKPPIHISAASGVFPAGPGLALASAALQAGQALNRLHPFYVDGMGQRVACAYFAEPAGFDFERWQELARAALLDLAPRVPRHDAAGRERAHHLLLVLPELHRAGLPDALSQRLVKACEGGPFRWLSVRVVHGGHAAGVQAVEQAMADISPMRATDPSASFVVLAVDSWVHPDALQWLEQEDLLHGSRKPYKGQVHVNAYGLVPSEGAAALWISRTPGLCQIAGLAMAQEPVLRGENRPTTGQGWTQAAQTALTMWARSQDHTGHGPLREMEVVWSDLNGEPYRADQFGFTGLRLSGWLKDNWKSVTPATVFGDLGSASAVAHMALAAQVLSGAGQAQTHLLLSASDDAWRGAMVLRGD
jgi:3-oxoacyl-[acyl-carrier-protein] synthase-1